MCISAVWFVFKKRPQAAIIKMPGKRENTENEEELSGQRHRGCVGSFRWLCALALTLFEGVTSNGIEQSSFWTGIGYQLEML